MITLCAEELAIHLRQRLCPCYLLFGNDFLLLEESQNYIRKQARSNKFNENFNIILDSNTDWEFIFSLCQTRSLFVNRQTLLLILPDIGVNTVIANKMLQLVSLLHEDIILILRGTKLTQCIKKSAWFKMVSKYAVLITCVTPEGEKLSLWLKKRAKNINLRLDDAACNLLCYSYEGNLLALSQVLEQIFLLYPDGKELTVSHVENMLNNSVNFTVFQWVHALLSGKIKRALHILHHLQSEDIHPLILLRNIQNEILFLLTLKRQISSVSLYTQFNKNKIWCDRRILLTTALERLSLAQLLNIVTMMTKIELTFKQDSFYPVWFDLRTLSLLLCGKSVSMGMFNA
ncbi:DNA polymerase III, delta subunit [secondary endosymbiont of Heteropsylla cubana]|uniref:DNA polymerase III subunit delta n=1 Tax=secondary endosymbiont of Heteropsylla cubana TaxID=134287 RepID=J3TGJ8_9ENTR|nr:DNA polymerase III subunit delta [secondary endosymbiont of Heteropsylla cubana]AFP85577.1 DNA polymerase III, delta subunit [secondary endosymbiont of Heteropsylla cubana]